MKEEKEFQYEFSKPFYLKEARFNKRMSIVIVLMLVVLGIAWPLLILSYPVILFIGYRYIKESKSEKSINLSAAISYYNNEEFEKSRAMLYKVLEEDKENLKANILFALTEYNRKEFDQVVLYLKNVPSKVLLNDLDLTMKLAESYKEIGEIERAEEIYRSLLKINPNSQYIKSALDHCREQSERNS